MARKKKIQIPEDRAPFFAQAREQRYQDALKSDPEGVAAYNEYMEEVIQRADTFTCPRIDG